MKKLLVIGFILFFSMIFVNAQNENNINNSTSKKVIASNAKYEFVNKNTRSTSILSEDFEGGAIPSGWTTIDGACTWTVSDNGSSDNLIFPDHTQYAFVNDDACGNNMDMSNVQLITPTFDLSTVSIAYLQFDSYTPYASETYNVLASDDGGTTWTTISTIPSNQEEWVKRLINLENYVGKSNVKISFQYSDKNNWYYGWAIDDISIYSPSENDLAMESIQNLIAASNIAYYPTVTIRNSGTNYQGNYSITVNISGQNGTVYNSTKTVSSEFVLSLSTKDITMDEALYAPEDASEYTLTAYVTLDGDEDHLNDTITCTLPINYYREVVAMGYKRGPGTAKFGNFLLGAESYNEWNADYNYYNGQINGVDFIGDDAYVFDDNGYIRKYNATTEEWTDVCRIFPDLNYAYMLNSFVYEPTNNKFYTVCRGGNYVRFLEIDIENGSYTVVGDSLPILEYDFYALARSNDGEYYALEYHIGDNAKLYKVDILAKTCNLVGDMGVKISRVVQFMNFEPGTNTLFLEVFSDEVPIKLLCGTFTVDLETAQLKPFGLPHDGNYMISGFAMRGDTSVGISQHENISENNISVYPNPAIDGQFNIKSDVDARVSILDFSGRLISEFSVNANEVKTIKQSKGLYIIKSESANNTSVHKIIIN